MRLFNLKFIGQIQKNSIRLNIKMLANPLRICFSIRGSLVKLGKDQIHTVPKSSAKNHNVTISILRRSGATIASNGVKIATRNEVPRIGK